MLDTVIQGDLQLAMSSVWDLEQCLGVAKDSLPYPSPPQKQSIEQQLLLHKKARGWFVY
jgi:hypothetical protein